MKDVNIWICRLVDYAIDKGLIQPEDEMYATNRILEAMQLDDFSPQEVMDSLAIEEILGALIEYAVGRKVIDEGVTAADLFDTKLMGCVTKSPSEVIRIFNELYEKSPKEATDWYYEFSANTDYIRRYRIEKDVKWTCDTEYGKLDITINLSKPEKDPKDIAAAKNAPQSSYPKCLLCPQNEGYAGRLNHPARQNHRIIPIKLTGEDWFFQYSPYVYYNEHCIIFNKEHVPMSITQRTFERLLDFVASFPHYTIGSNADLPIVGGSILTHDHFQGGNYEFAMENAKEINEFEFENGVKGSTLVWPLSVIRLKHKDKQILADCAGEVLKKWREYSDENVDIYAYTEQTPHNTITPIARNKNSLYELDLVLRNNRTSSEHPMGIFHPHSELHHIKKENIGLIEVMGLAVLPSRLKAELSLLSELIKKGEEISTNKNVAHHAEWANDFMKNYTYDSDIDSIVYAEVGKVFAQVLEHAGVYKQTAEGREAFVKFIQTL